MRAWRETLSLDVTVGSTAAFGSANALMTHIRSIQTLVDFYQDWWTFIKKPLFAVLQCVFLAMVILALALSRCG